MTRLLSFEFKNETVAVKNFSAKFGTFMKYVDLCLIGVELCKKTRNELDDYGCSYSPLLLDDLKYGKRVLANTV